MALVETRYPALTDQSLAEARKLIGVRLRRGRPWNRAATKDNVKAFVKAVGSRNPLYLSPTYAETSGPYGCLVAPGTFLYSMDDTLIGPGLPGIHMIFAAGDWEFYDVIRVNDEIEATATLVDAWEKNGRFCGRMIFQKGEVIYRTQYGKIVARCFSTVARTPRDAARQEGKYASVTKYSYTDTELKIIGDGLDGEEIRGSRVRYWEDVKEGDKLTPVVKNGLTSEDMICFVDSVKGVKTFAVAREHRRKHPADLWIDPNTGMPDSWEGSWLKDNTAQEFGWPAAHDTGYQRICYLDNLLTNWAGDYGFVTRLGAKVLLPAIYGDTQWCKGRVTGKHIDERKRHLVDMDVWCENQRSEITAQGYATVALATRDLDTGISVYGEEA
ncbi:MAG: MaoC family dehydratase N-terminal domain-containing protein [Chloroflexi bacterium]|nr:MaoC family dehydratase N-terminal domain-containing protein [Chloroflexota bacterium]